MHNYFNYFTEIEERFQQRRGSLLMLSTLDWALIETWREAGVPLRAVLRGIDDAFDKHDAQRAKGKGRTRRVNGLAWAAQSVMLATEAAVDASTGVRLDEDREKRETGFEPTTVSAYLTENAGLVAKASQPEIAERLASLASEVAGAGIVAVEELDRTLSVLEEQMMARLIASTPEGELVSLREQAQRELAPYRGRMHATQIRQIEQQFVGKRLLEAQGLPRLSLFYMKHA